MKTRPIFIGRYDEVTAARSPDVEDDRVALARAAIRTQRNLSPSQRIWARRRARWAQNRQDRFHNLTDKTWADAVKNGNERSFLKREGEGD